MQKIHLLIPPATILNIPGILLNARCLDDHVIHNNKIKQRACSP